MRRRRHRHVSALMTLGITGSALGAGLGGGILATRPSAGVHHILSSPSRRAVPASARRAPAGVSPVGARLDASVSVSAAGLAEPDGSLFTSSGSWPAIGGLVAPVVGWAARPGGGAWEVSADGGVFSRGAAPFYGSTGGVRLSRPIVGMASTPSGRGYWLVASDGGVFSFGDARFHGSTGGVRLSRPIVGMASTPTGGGYWLTAADGGLFSFGGAGFSGSVSGRDSSGTVSVSADGNGYDEVQGDGSVWTFAPGRPPMTSRLPVPAAETMAANAVAVALSEVGKPYVYGASGPNSFDCSGLIQYAYRRAGVALPRSTQQQLAATHPVPAADLQPGDLVFFYPGATHVGIYLGDGTMVDAPHSGAAVRVESIQYFGPVVAVTSPVV